MKCLPSRRALFLWSLLALAAVGRANDEASLAVTVQELPGPCSIAYDPLVDCWYVGCSGGGRDEAHGSIARLDGGGAVDIDAFIAEGQGGVVLREPRALEVWGHEIWVADVDAVRVFDRRDGQPLWAVDLRWWGEVSLTDLTLSPNGLVAVARDGAVPGGRFFRIDRERRAEVVSAQVAADALGGMADSDEGQSVGASVPVRDLAMAPDRDWIGAVSADGNAVQFWRVADMGVGLVLENAWVIVHRNVAVAEESLPAFGYRVLVALGDIELATEHGLRRMAKGEVQVIESDQNYTAPTTGDFVEVVLKTEHPPYRGPREVLPPRYNRQIYDGPDFFIYEERLEPGQMRPRHSHGQRVTLPMVPAELFRLGGRIPSPQVPGRVGFSNPSVHRILNMGGTRLSNVIIEFKPEP